MHISNQYHHLNHFRRLRFLTFFWIEKNQQSVIMVELVHLTEHTMHKDISSYKCQSQENKVWQLYEIVGGGVQNLLCVNPNFG